MHFYGIVSKLHTKPGLYVRTPPAEGELQSAQSELPGGTRARRLAPLLLVFSPLASGSLWLYGKLRRRDKRPLHRIEKLRPRQNVVWINGRWLGSDFSLSDGDRRVLHDLLESEDHFEALMSAEGNSDLMILPRDEVSKLGLVHYGGPGAIFDPGLYCQHPKDNRTLLPVSRASELLKDEILEEVVRTFEALGATHIRIEDVTETSGSLGGKKDKIGVEVSGSRENRVLREKKYQPDRIDVERALSNKKHIRDMPSVMSIVDARIRGNQLLDVFEQIVETNCGLNASVLDLFSAKVKGTHRRTWKFRVEFASKSSLGR